MRWLLAVVAGLILTGVLAATADARPGGGHSYSGGGGGRSSSSYRSSGGGGGGGGDLGTVGIIAFIGFGILIVVGLTAEDKESEQSWTSHAPPRPVSRTDLKPLLAKDPAFSQTVFEDFAFNLYAAAQRARGKPDELSKLAPYFTPGGIEYLVRAQPVQAVVIGSLRVTAVTISLHDDVTLEVRIEANLASANGTTNVIEKWTFTRAAGVQSRPPDKTRAFPCPKCNAPFAAGASPRTCAHCGTDIAPGRFDWTVSTMTLGASSSVGLTLTGTVAEVGTSLPTVLEPDAYPLMMQLYEADKNVTWDSFSVHLTMTYKRLNDAWNAQDLTPVRGLVTRSLLGYLQFWVDEYKRQRLANKLDDAQITRLAIAKVQRDSHYDAITVRVYANGKDYTVDAAGNVVGGSKSSVRAYSEYWTFIRSASRRGPITIEPKCPNCGAPLSISDAGACTHCSVEVESGCFDWVLSKIEQDEVYAG